MPSRSNQIEKERVCTPCSAGFFPEVATPPPPHRTLSDLSKIFIAPAVIEEILFRAILLPCPTTTSKALSRSKLALWASGALVAFVLYHHPLQTFISPRILPVFSQPAFLTMATVLGVVCSGTYIVSRSLWPPIVIHWATVSVWYFKLGGYEKLVQGGYVS